jgi:KDO2-lipid IV(A) lauroyltransferase
MWYNYGKIFSEYMFLRKFRNSPDYSKNILIKNYKILEEIKKNNEPVIFVSGHFNNFELMAMYLDKFGINLAAIYRPLNNKFLNPIMEYIRKKYICINQVKKGISGTKQLLKQFKNKTSIALMIDQRVSQGIKSHFFNEPAFTTTIPAQFVKKFNAKVVPIYIERTKENKFNLEIYEPLIFNKTDSIEQITDELNQLLEKMILKNPDQWIWTHNRWK